MAASYRYKTPNGKRLNQFSRRYDKALARIDLMALDPDRDISTLKAFEELIDKLEKIFEERIEPLAKKRSKKEGGV